MVPFNIKVVAEFGLCSNGSQKLRGCSQNFRKCTHAGILVRMCSIARNLGDLYFVVILYIYKR